MHGKKSQVKGDFMRDVGHESFVIQRKPASLGKNRSRVGDNAGGKDSRSDWGAFWGWRSALARMALPNSHCHQCGYL